MLALGRDGTSFAQLTPADELQAVLADADRLCLRVSGGNWHSCCGCGTGNACGAFAR
jgi:hypothetical protein